MLMLPTHFVPDVCQYDRFRNIGYQSRYHNHEAPFLQKNMEREVFWPVELHIHLPESSFSSHIDPYQIITILTFPVYTSRAAEFNLTELLDLCKQHYDKFHLS